ncbi:MAG: pilus assembly protein CpaC, partial [Abditibacteriota bacterium]|nr:pilus assembly protein CpaC [Abditibacteriota bacterium]
RAQSALEAQKSVALPLDKDVLLPFPEGSTFSLTSGANLVRVTRTPGPDENGKTWLHVEPLSAGRAVISVTSVQGTTNYTINVRDSATVTTTPAPAAAEAPAATTAPVEAAPAANSGANVQTPANDATSTGASVTVRPSLPIEVEPAPAPQREVAPLPALRGNDVPIGRSTLPSGMAPVIPEPSEPHITPILPQPSRLPSGNAAFPSAPATPRQVRSISNNVGVTGRSINVTQGLARFLSFRENILSVFFSDVNVMDARAMNARTVAVTGSAPGKSTLAVFVSRYPGDVVGKPEIFNIVVESPTPRNTLPAGGRDAATIELAIRSAISDPRVQVSVIQQPNGAFAAKLTGALRDLAERQAAIDTAALFVPRDQVISALYLDPAAPTLAQAQNPTQTASNEQILQAKLRQITGNETIELVSLPTGVAVKAEVDSAADAETLLGLLPTLNQRVLPFIVVRGQNGARNGSAANGNLAESGDGRFYGAQRPILTGEDQEITRRLHEVTGVRSVSAVRTAQNAIAVYGTVRNRIEYETVRRYLLMLPLIGPQTSVVSQQQSFSTGSFGGGGAAAQGGRQGVPAGARPLVSPQMDGQTQFNANAQVTPGAPAGGIGAGGIGAGGIGGATGTGVPAAGPTVAPANGGFPGGGFGGAAEAGTGIGTGAGVGIPNNFGTGPLSTAPLASGPAGFTPGAFPPGFNPNVPGNYSFSQQGSGLSNSYAVSQAEGFIDPLQALKDPVNRAQQPAGGYQQSVNLQMFVRVLDEDGRSVRRVTAETSIVEISRNTLRNLGVQAGTVAILNQNTTPPILERNPATGNRELVSPGTVTRTIDPTFREGVFTAANGIVGLEGFRVLDPLRARINALYQKGNARVLSEPNITAIEGADAQIVVGGERPVPSAVTSGQAVGQSIVFRRFGIILTIRPTVTDDDTIIMQIRADVTELDTTSGININGALIPGERVRSINTTLNMREGDIIVLGGLISNDRREQTSRVPILSSIPILGNLFKSRRFENNESELAIFLSPRITRMPASMNTQEAVNRVPALPLLPTNQQGTATFDTFGSSNGQQ